MVWCGAQGRLDDQRLLLYMLHNDIALQASLDCYRNNYMDCSIKMTSRKGYAATEEKSDGKAQSSEAEEEMQRQLLEHMQNFLFEVTTCYLVLGFVVFRFCRMPGQPNTLVPVVVPIGDIEWSYEGTHEKDDQELLRIPAIDIPRDLSGRDTRYYVYMFRSNGHYYSGDVSGVLFRLTKSYRRLVHARDYDLIVRNENLRKTVFVEQNLKQDISVLNQGTRASDYGELQAIMDYTRGRKQTTHSVTPPTQSEELRASISVSAHHADAFVLRAHSSTHVVCCIILTQAAVRRNNKLKELWRPQSNLSCCHQTPKPSTSRLRRTKSTSNTTRGPMRKSLARYFTPHRLLAVAAQFHMARPRHRLHKEARMLQVQTMMAVVVVMAARCSAQCCFVRSLAK